MPPEPAENPYLTRAGKESILKQHARCIWLTGLPGSGKSTIARGLEKKLAAKGYFVRLLDAGQIRNGLNSNLAYSEEDRYENIRRVAEVNRLFVESGIITINAFISPTRKIRQMARSLIGEEDFMEIYVEASLAACIRRDPKGLYKKALDGKILNFTGVDAAYEIPLHPDLIINTESLTEVGAVELALAHVVERIKH